MNNLNGTKKLSKKQTRKIVFNKLSNALVEYNIDLKGKKVNSNLKKLSKVLATDIVKTTRKQNEKTKKLKTKVLKTDQEQNNNVLQAAN
jgi:Fe2+ transport system protein B